MLFSPVYAKPHPRRTVASRSHLILVSPPTNAGSLSKGFPDSFTPHAPEIPPRSDAHFASRMWLQDLSHLEPALTDRHRVLPVFSRNSQSSSPLEATLTSIPVCVDFKWFAENLSPLDATLTKNTGGGGHPHFPIPSLCLHSTFNRRSRPCRNCSLLRAAAGHGTRVTGHAFYPPFVPLQRKAFGATIRKGTGFLHDPRKQLRSPRCLRLMSGHRGQFDGVPDLPRFSRGCKSTVSGFMYLQTLSKRVSGFVLTNPEQTRRTRKKAWVQRSKR